MNIPSSFQQQQQPAPTTTTATATMRIRKKKTVNVFYCGRESSQSAAESKLS